MKGKLFVDFKCELCKTKWIGEKQENWLSKLNMVTAEGRWDEWDRTFHGVI